MECNRSSADAATVVARRVGRTLEDPTLSSLVTMSETETLTFVFDVISPYAYLAWTQLPALAKRHGLTVRPRPVLFAAMLDANETRGPAEIAAKRRYVFRDVVRTAHHLGVPVAAPLAHPFNPLLALRVAALEMDEPIRCALVTELFEATWVHRQGVFDPEVVAAIAQRVGLPKAVERAQGTEAKAALRSLTSAALDSGVFGVPSVITPKGELFWGLDSFGNLDRHLGGSDPVDLSQISAWEGLPAQSRRPGSTRTKQSPS